MKNGESVMMLAPILTPHGVLTLRRSGDVALLEPGLGSRLEKAFAKGSGHGLLCLGADEVGTVLPPMLSYWREFGGRYVTALCALRGIGEGRAKPPVPAPAQREFEQMVLAVPPMTGAEYLTSALLADLWHRIDAAFDAELAAAKLTVQEFLKGRHPAWNLVGRVHFNLAENRKDEDAPFAFLATYTTRLSMEAKAQHLALGKALQEYAGASNREHLLSLLVPVQRAAEQCPWLKAMVDAGEIYHPLRWSPAQALASLKDVPALEGAGVVVRMPASWSKNRPARPQVKVTVGGKPPSEIGMDALLDFQMEVTLDGKHSRRPISSGCWPNQKGSLLCGASGSKSITIASPARWNNSRRSGAVPPMKACRSARPCVRWPVPASPVMDLQMRPSAIGARLWPGRGSQKRWKSSVTLMDSLAPIPGNRFRARCVRISRRVCNGSICLRGSGSVHALPTTWASARPSRCCRCCWCSEGSPGIRASRAWWWRRHPCWPTGLYCQAISVQYT